MEYVKADLVDRALRKQERDNLKQYGKSMSSTSMSEKLNEYLICFQTDNKICEMKDNWRDAIKKFK